MADFYNRASAAAYWSMLRSMARSCINARTNKRNEALFLLTGSSPCVTPTHRLLPL